MLDHIHCRNMVSLQCGLFCVSLVVYIQRIIFHIPCSYMVSLQCVPSCVSSVHQHGKMNSHICCRDMVSLQCGLSCDRNKRMIGHIPCRYMVSLLCGYSCVYSVHQFERMLCNILCRYIWFLPCVDPHVFIQFTSLRESFVTFFAGIWYVDPHVTLHASRSRGMLGHIPCSYMVSHLCVPSWVSSCVQIERMFGNIPYRYMVSCQYAKTCAVLT